MTHHSRTLVHTKAMAVIGNVNGVQYSTMHLCIQ